MTILRQALWGLLLGLLLLWFPSGTGAQGPMISVLGCRADAEELARKAEDSSIDDKVFNNEMAKFQKKCKTREAGSMRSIASNREQFKVQQAELRGSHKHVQKVFGVAGAAPGIASSPNDETVDKYLAVCLGKSTKDASCEKLRKDFVDILKEDLLKLGSTADRSYLPDIVRMFRSDEVELRIAAADAIGMIGPEDGDVDMLIPLTNDPVPDVRQAVRQMISRGKGTVLTLLTERTMPMRTGRTPETPVDAGKYSMPVAPDSAYLFDSSDASVGRLSYVIKGKSDTASFFKAKAKKGPFQLQEFKDKYRYQFQDEDEAMNLAQVAEGKQMENVRPPDPRNVQAYTEYMQKIQSVGAKQGSRIYLDSYQPNLYGSPTVYVLEERQIGQRNYPTRYVVLYQEQALRKPGYRLSWMTVPDSAIKTAQTASIAEEQEELARNKENEALKKREEALESLTKKKDEAEKKKFKKGQADLEKELGF